MTKHKVGSPEPLSTPSERKKWSVAFLLGAVFSVPSILYTLALAEDTDVATSLLFWSLVSAATASLLFAASFSMGSLSYFIGWPNMRQGYQKQIGILAFWVALFYCCTLLVLYPETYFYGFLSNFWTADILLGLGAMIIFGGMVVINSKPIAPFFSWDTIKFVLGLGLIGYALLVIRAIFLEWPLWEHWLQTFDSLPPGRFGLSVLACAVLVLRVLVMIHQHWSRSRKL